MKISKEQIQKIFSNLEFINKIMDDNVPAAECKKYFTDESVEISENELEEMKKLMVAINQIDPEKIDEKDLANIAGGINTAAITPDDILGASAGMQISTAVVLGITSFVHFVDGNNTLAKKLGIAALALTGTSAVTGIAAGTIGAAFNQNLKNESKKVLDKNPKSKK